MSDPLESDDATIPVTDPGTVPPPQEATAPPPELGGTARRRRFADWQPNQVVAGLYRVKKVLGQGGMGRVYQVRHLGWNVDLAVKTILPGRARDVQMRERFLREAETWVGLGMHPAIAQCYYVREIRGQPHIFVEWVGGGSLKDWITNKQVQPGHWVSICDLGIQACDGLGHAHEHGVIHRDIKPANFLVTPQGELKVTDFGLAKSLNLTEETPASEPAPSEPEGQDDSLTLPGQVMGTPSYGAPEQWEAGRSVDRRADIYSLGVVLFELAGGRRPFDNERGGRPMRVELLRRHMEDEPPKLSALRDDVPAGLVELVDRCLRKDPAERFQTMAEVREALCAVYALEAGHEHPRANLGRIAMPAASLNNRGASEFDLGRATEALASWRQALSLEPDHPEATYNEAMLAWDRGETDDLEAVRRVGALMGGPHRERAAYLLGLLHLQRADADAAYRALQMAADRENPDVWLALGRAQLALGAWAAAETTLDIALDQGHDTVRAQELRERARSRRRPPRGLLGLPPRVATPRPPKCLRSQEEPGAINDVLLLPGWRGLAASSSGEVTLWDLTCGERLRTFYGHEGAVHALASVDEETVLSAGADRTVRTWNLNEDTARSVLETPSAVTSLAYEPEQGLLAVGGRDRRARVFRLGDTQPLATHSAGQEEVHALAWTDGALLVASDRLRLCSPEQVFVLPPQEHGVFALWTRGDRCLSGGGNGDVVEWDLTRRAPIRTLKGHGGAVLALAVDSQGRLISASRDRTLKRWDLEAGRARWTSAQLAAPITCLAFSDDGSLLISGGHDRRLRTWSLARAQRPWQPALSIPRSVGDEVERQQDLAERIARAESALKARDAATARQALAEARELPGGARDPRVRELAAQLVSKLPPTALRARWQLQALSGHRRSLRCLVRGPGERVLAGGEGSRLQLWAPGESAPLTTLEGHGAPATCAAFDGASAISGSEDRTVRFWSLDEAECTHTFNQGAEVVAVGVGLGQAAALSAKGALRRWTFPGGEERADLQVGERVVRGAFGLDARLCLVVEHDHRSSLKLVDARSGLDVQELELVDPDRALTCVAFGALERTALACDDEGHLRVWDLVGGKVLLDVALPGTTFDSTPDGRFLLVGGRAGPPVLFDLLEGEVVDTLEGSRPVSFAGGGRYALAGSGADLLVWELDWILADAPGSPLLAALGVRGSREAVVTRYGLNLVSSGTRKVKRRSRAVGIARREADPLPQHSGNRVEASRWYVFRAYLWPALALFLLASCIVIGLLVD